MVEAAARASNASARALRRVVRDMDPSSSGARRVRANRRATRRTTRQAANAVLRHRPLVADHVEGAAEVPRAALRDGADQVALQGLLGREVLPVARDPEDRVDAG